MFTLFVIYLFFAIALQKTQLFLKVNCWHIVRKCGVICKNWHITKQTSQTCQFYGVICIIENMAIDIMASNNVIFCMSANIYLRSSYALPPPMVCGVAIPSLYNSVFYGVIFCLLYFITCFTKSQMQGGVSQIFGFPFFFFH